MGRGGWREERDMKSWTESAGENMMGREVWRWVGRVKSQIGDGMFHLIVPLPFSICVFHLCFSSCVFLVFVPFVLPIGGTLPCKLHQLKLQFRFFD